MGTRVRPPARGARPLVAYVYSVLTPRGNLTEHSRFMTLNKTLLFYLSLKLVWLLALVWAMHTILTRKYSKISSFTPKDQRNEWGKGCHSRDKGPVYFSELTLGSCFKFRTLCSGFN